MTVFNPVDHARSAGVAEPLDAKLLAAGLRAGQRRAGIGLPASLVNQFEEPGRFPYITASNYQYFGESSSNIWYAPSTNLSFAPTLALIRGRHSIKAGLDFRLMHLANYQSAFAGEHLCVRSDLHPRQLPDGGFVERQRHRFHAAGRGDIGRSGLHRAALFQLALLCALGAGRYQTDAAADGQHGLALGRARSAHGTVQPAELRILPEPS